MRASDTFFVCMFWFFMALASFLLLWEFVAAVCCRREEPEVERESPEAESAGTKNPPTPADEVEEWDKLSEEERRWFRWFFK